MDWEIRLPIGNRQDPIGCLGFDAQHMDSEADAAVARQLAWDAIEEGHRTVGDYVDHLESLPEADRRAVLDKARTKVGLEPTGVIEQRRSDFLFEAEFQRLQPPDPPRWSPLQRCPQCGAYPGEGGSWKPVTCERWWCDHHKHLAAEGDLDEHVPAIIGLSPSGAPVYSPNDRRRRAEWLKKDADDRERKQRQREQHDKAVAEATEAARERYREEGEISIWASNVGPTEESSSHEHVGPRISSRRHRLAAR